jgi:hypothetical protein
VLGHYVIEPARRALGRPAATSVTRRRVGARVLTPATAAAAEAGRAVFDQPAAGTRVICDHPAGPWGNPGHYDGGYVPGMEIYWRARNGSCRLP